MALSKSQTKKVSRRGFLKGSAAAAGVAAGAGMVAASSSAMAGSPSEQFRPKGLTKFPIRKLDEFPFDVSGMTRFAGVRVVPYIMGRELYSNALERMREGAPGHSMADWALWQAAWVSSSTKALFDWNGTGMMAGGFFPPRAEYIQTVGKWQGTADEAAIMVKKAARILGAADAGIAPLRQLWFYSVDMMNRPVEFVDIEQPVATHEVLQIPNSMKYLIVMAVPMNFELARVGSGAAGGAAVGQGYSRMAEVASKVADFIRNLGYQAIPMGNDTGLSVPMAVEAGLGEQVRTSFIAHPVLGTNLRLCKVLTDLPLTTDKPITFGAHEFCLSCKKCAENCPVQAITFEDDYNEPACATSSTGSKRWYVNAEKCGQWWKDGAMPCNRCVVACPFNKPQTWMHDVVKGVAGTTTAFNSLFVALDDVMGYGDYFGGDVEADFWKTEDWPNG